MCYSSHDGERDNMSEIDCGTESQRYAGENPFILLQVFRAIEKNDSLLSIL